MSKNKPYKSFNYYLNTIYLKLLGYSQYFVGISDKQYFKNLELVFDRNKINDPQSIFLLQYHTFEFFVTPDELGNHLHFEGDIAFSRKDSNFKHCSYLFHLISDWYVSIILSGQVLLNPSILVRNNWIT
ncbi:MAG: hypothetical protein JNK41_01420 [Saprospiraceae bacterium]|nr:hypothetical protein [Saprospiraceae bacterium]